VAVDVLRHFLATPLPAFVFKVPDELLLLGIDRNHRPSPRHRPPHLTIDVPELGIPIRVIFPFFALAVAL
jgi:hypothetical protein